MRPHRLPDYRLLGHVRIMHGDPNTTYEWSYTNNGQTSAGEFTTNEYGQASFDVPEDVDCNKLEITKDEPPILE
jgi:hypothetical protein